MYWYNKDKPAPHPASGQEYSCGISRKELKDVFANCADFETRGIDPGLAGGEALTVCWLDGIVSAKDVSECVLRPLTEVYRSGETADAAALMERLLSGGVYSCSVKKCGTADELLSALTHGHCAIVFESLGAALSFEVRSSNVRSIGEPTLEKSIKGAKDSFVETLRTNTALVRRRICTPKLKVVESAVGRKSHTNVAVMFIDGVVDPALVEETCRRLDALDVDALVSTGTLEEYIVDKPLSPFPQLLHTERPDRFAAYLLEGRVGILADGLPVGLVLPVTFAEFMRVGDDRANHFSYAAVLTLLRYLALFIALYLPALYVAVALYHQEMIPTGLLISIIEAKQNVPFSTALEVTGMLIAFSLLQEAGLRLPNPVGDTVSIIGALIVGQSAVEAQVVSPIAIIVVAFSGIACYTLPSQDMGAAVRLSRFALLLAAMAAGLFGVFAASCLLLLHLAGIDSYGVNYTAPLTDGRPWGLIRLLFLPPKFMDKFRDPLLNTPDKRRQK